MSDHSFAASSSAMSFEEVRQRRLEALMASCIKECITKKPDGYQEWSWREKRYYGSDIFPGVVNQGQRDVCQFCAITSAGQMELNAKYAKWNRSRCRLRFQWESLLTRFFELHGFRPEQGEEERKMMEQKYIEQDESIYDWDDASAWCFENLGVLADGDKAVVHYPLMSASNMYMRFSTITDDGIKEIVENSRLVSQDNIAVNLGIDGYKYFEDLTEQEIWNYVENGRAVAAGVLAGKSFDHLKPDEIYAWIPYFKVGEDGNKKWVDEPVPHAIVLMGNGNAGPLMAHEQYHPFLNSYGEKYAGGGVGSLFAKALYGGFTLLEVKDKLKHVSTRMCDLDNDFPRPKLYEE